jgi:hypothetical protein
MLVGNLWQGRRPPHPFASPPSLPSFLFKVELELPLSPLHLQHTYTRARSIAYT